MEAVPYNKVNRLIDESEVRAIFKEFGLELKPRNMSLYRKAFVHRSYCVRKNENIIDGNRSCPEGCVPLQEESNERLEFLGDSVINLLVAAYMYERFPDENEGFLTRLRTRIVNGVQLAEFARRLGLDRYMVVSAQIEAAGGRTSAKLLEDAFEAFVGAMYLDFNEMRIKNEKLHGFGIGLQAVQVWLIEMMERNVDFTELIGTNENHKERLIRYVVQQFGVHPRFVERPSSSASTAITVAVLRGDEVLSTFTATTRKVAEQGAARLALEYLGCACVGAPSF
jgi:ribonuclease III